MIDHSTVIAPVQVGQFGEERFGRLPPIESFPLGLGSGDDFGKKNGRIVIQPNFFKYVVATV